MKKKYLDYKNADFGAPLTDDDGLLVGDLVEPELVEVDESVSLVDGEATNEKG